MKNPFNLPLQGINSFGLNRIFLIVLVSSVVLGTIAGYLFVGSGAKGTDIAAPLTQAPKTAQQDNRTFRDFAEGVIQKRPDSKDTEEYVEGTHLLIRDGAIPVALTSSVVDLNQYEGKKVKVFGETQKAIKEGWLMDVGRVEVK